MAPTLAYISPVFFCQTVLVSAVARIQTLAASNRWFHQNAFSLKLKLFVFSLMHCNGSMGDPQ